MKTLILAAFAGVVALASVPASAMPVAPSDINQDGLVTQVAGGCGPGWHPNRFGRCTPNRRPVVVVRPGYGVYGRPGWRRCGPYGRRCRW